MLTLNIILSIVLGAALLVTLFYAYRSYRRWQLNDVMAHELDAILKSTLAAVDRNEKLSKSQSNFRLNVPNPTKDPYLASLQSPEMISTMLTVLVNKYGTVRLALSDFMKIKDQDYISIYVDYNSKELILSMNHNLVEEQESIMMGNFPGPDDNTFH